MFVYKSFVSVMATFAAITLPHTLHVCGRNLITGLTSAASPRVDISSTCKVGQKLGVSLPLLTSSVDMFPFGVTIPATVPHRSEIPEGLMNYPVSIHNPTTKNSGFLTYDVDWQTVTTFRRSILGRS